jgi:type IV fimbrial biogenesis protein FimT
MGCKPIKRLSAGFTVTELVMVMLIVGILVAIGTPTFKYVTTSNRISGEINGLLGDMQFARTEAIKEGQSVTVCASSNGTQCIGTGVWNTGWIVFLDLQGTGQVAAGDTVIRIQPGFSSQDTFVASSGYSAATYNRMGYAPTGSNVTITINLHDSTNTSNWTRCLAISPIGAATTEVFGAGSPQCN